MYNKSQRTAKHVILRYGFTYYILEISVLIIKTKYQLEDWAVLTHSPDLLNNVKIVQDQLWLIMIHILFYGGWGRFGQVALNISNEYSIKQPSDF